MCRQGNKVYGAAVLSFAAMCALPAGLALAERTDRDKPLNIESNSMVSDETRKVATFEGTVVLTQGSLLIHADRIVVRQDEQGFYHGVATGNPATFRHKQEGKSEFIDGQALKIEYDNKLERVEFFNDARLRRDSGDDIRGDYISYDTRTERFAVKSAGASGTDRGGRVTATIMPKKQVEPQTPPASGTGRPE